jgi:hypothetical protein
MTIMNPAFATPTNAPAGNRANAANRRQNNNRALDQDQNARE